MNPLSEKVKVGDTEEAEQSVRIREVSVLEKYPYLRGIRIREVSVLERCPYQRGVSIRKVSVL